MERNIIDDGVPGALENEVVDATDTETGDETPQRRSRKECHEDRWVPEKQSLERTRHKTKRPTTGSQRPLIRDQLLQTKKRMTRTAKAPNGPEARRSR